MISVTQQSTFINMYNNEGLRVEIMKSSAGVRIVA